MISSRRRLLGWTGVLAVAALAAQRSAWAQAGAQGHRTLEWDDLIPPGWDPMAAFRQAGIDPRQVPEGGAQEVEASRKLRAIWDQAPVRQELQGERIRLPGYVVPLEYTQGALREFLLVPYFGACIHSPPPPANQIVLVRLDKPAALQTMDVIWAWGELIVHRHRTEWGLSGYLLQARGTAAYKEPRRR